MKNDGVAMPRSFFGPQPSQSRGEGSFVPGDDFAYYALRGDISRVVVSGKVVGRPRYEAHRDLGWPWLIDIAVEVKRISSAMAFLCIGLMSNAR
jgi:hypothetical protein